ncbi:hypothetical protein DNK06_02555 [Pseudomonas daroniae]|uniref:DUF6250 domain-containing protein n=1 Tax=Phytopseudomonas daroniae TaxID=2487519 RepID=A0A4Q9QR83_9GAMM|nr:MULTISPECIES: DUF6250 domain-containing protein [Pseudomonas]TBU77130.1 hypothetical protein DNK10_06340 [Pseudomonas daroniae]TBU83339.1 hypothetical protein DNK06_02555 [Pseudomonas daroniae]TBU84978.1 hypothetical protein DNK31_04935 [Pseudomonas sp. FRB 228]TBU93729.1 hypothetical protein DNJ99_05135 [Pseudomonas daroniae]
MPFPSCTEHPVGGNKLPDILLEDDFSHFSTQRWHVEAEDPATRVQTERGQLLIDSPRGVTVWLKQPLDGAYRIEFQRQVLLGDGANDRLSDLNQFWAARDPGNADLFTRSGALAEYDSLALYYVGMGGNYNSTTRFRRYDGGGQRLVLGEYLDPAHLLEANRPYHIALELDARGTRYLVDGDTFFQARHDGLPPPGHFGFRQVWSRQAISAFRVTRLG